MLIMNYLKIKIELFSLLAILAVSVFLTSCEQDKIVPLNEVNNIKTSYYENYSESFDVDAHLKKNAQFSKVIDIKNSAEKKFGVSELGIRVKSNDKEVLDKFDEDAVVFKYNETDSNPATEAHTGLNKKSTVKAPKWNEDAKLVQIDILGINREDSYKENEYIGYALEFSDDIKSYLKENNVSLSINFTGSDEQTKTHLKYSYFLFVDKATIYATGGTYAYYYYTNCNIDINCSYSSPTYYHSSKYFYSSWPWYYPVKDDVAICCLQNCSNGWKTLKRVYLYNGYASNIYVSRNFCLLNYSCNGGPCYYG